MKIGLLFGGKSFEHDISIITANLAYHALKDEHQVYLLYIDKKGDFRIIDSFIIDDFLNGKKFRKFAFIKHGIKCGIKKVKIDVLISAMHGTNGEDGVGASIANIYDIPFVGSNHISSGVLMDKYFSYAVLRSRNIKSLSTRYYLKDEKINIKRYPIIIKPSRLGSSIGIVKVVDSNVLDDSLNRAFLFDTKIIIQPYIENFKEYNQAVFSLCGKICTSKIEEVYKSKDILSFDDKYINSKTEKKHTFLDDEHIIEKITIISKQVYKLFELSGVVRIDYMVINGEIYVNEVNTTPGSFAYYLFDYNLKELLEMQIKNSLFEYQNKQCFIFESSVLSQKYNYKK